MPTDWFGRWFVVAGFEDLIAYCPNVLATMQPYSFEFAPDFQMKAIPSSRCVTGDETSTVFTSITQFVITNRFYRRCAETFRPFSSSESHYAIQTNLTRNNNIDIVQILI